MAEIITVRDAELYIHLSLIKTIASDAHGMNAIDLIGLMDYADYIWKENRTAERWI